MSHYMGEIVKLRGAFFDAYNSGEYTEAIRLGNEIIKLYKDNKDVSSLEYANDINNIAIVYDDVMAHDKAVGLYKTAAEIRRRLVGENDLSYADTISNMAVSISFEGRHNEALVLHKKALRIREDNLPETHEDCIISLYNLANSYEDLKNYDKALEKFEKSLKRAEKNVEFSKKDYADILCGYARALAQKGMFKKSISSYCKAVEIIKMEEGGKNFYYLSTLLEAAGVCERAKLYEQAIVYYKRAIEVRKTILDKTHLDYITNLNSLANAFVKKGDYDRAIETYKESLNILKGLVGEEHQFYADCLNNIGVNYIKKQDFDSAVDYISRSMDLKKKIGGRSTLSYTIGLESLGHVYRDKNNFEMAFEKYNEARIIRKQLSGESDPLYIEAVMDLGRLCLNENKLDRAEEYFKDALRLRKNITGPKDMSYVINLQLLAEIDEKNSEFEDALYHMQEALSVRKAVYGRNHPRYARGLYYTAIMEMKCGKFEDAVNDFEFAIEIQRVSVGEDNSDFKDTVNEFRKARIKLCKYYTEIGQYDKALSHLKQSMDFFGCKDSEEKTATVLKYAFLYDKNGNRQKAFSLIREAKSNIVLKYGDCCLQFADALKAEGMLLVETGDILEGEKLLVRALETEFILLGDKERSLAEISIFMGNALLKEGDLKRAEGYYLKASRNKDGEGYYMGEAGLGFCAFANKDFDSAYAHFENAKSYMEKYTGTESRIFANIAQKISIIDEKRKNLEAAMACLESSISVRRGLGDDDEDYTDDLIRLGALCKKLGKKDEASEYFSEASAIVKKRDGESIEFAQLILKTAKINVERKNYSLSEVLYTKCAEIYGMYYGRESDEYASVICDMAKMYVKTKEDEKSDRCFKELKAITEKNKDNKFNNEKYFKQWHKIRENNENIVDT